MLGMTYPTLPCQNHNRLRSTQPYRPGRDQPGGVASVGSSKPSTSDRRILLEENLVSGERQSRDPSGRKPTNLKLKSDGALVLGIDLDVRTTTYTVANIHGAILRMEKFPIQEHPDPKTAGAEVIKRILKLTRESKVPFKAIVLTTGGTFSEDRRTLVAHNYWSWEQIPLAEVIERTPIPTIFAETTRSMSRERWFHKETLHTSISIRRTLESAITSTASTALPLRTHPVGQTGLCSTGQIRCLERSPVSRIGKEDLPHAAMAIGKALIAADRRLRWMRSSSPASAREYLPFKRIIRTTRSSQASSKKTRRLLPSPWRWTGNL